MRTSIKTLIFLIIAATIISCEKDATPSTLHYYQVAFKGDTPDWRDSSFIIATADTAIISRIEAQLALPVAQRKMVKGPLVNGSGGYNKNAGHQFKWHLKEDQLTFVDLSAEIYDGRPYNDVDRNLDYWLNSMKLFGPWSSYVSKEIIP